MNHQIKALELVSSITTISIGNSKNMRAFVDNEGGIWFCLRDVLEAMNSKTRTNDVIPTITDIFGAGTTRTYQLDTGFGVKPTIFAHESATTYIIANGNTETSKSLNRKIHAEILPELRKAGKYEVEAPSKTQQVLDVILMLQNDLATEKNLRLEAERTKAMIGDKKVATAMATASAASRKVTVLKRKNQVLKEENQVLEEENQTFKKKAEEETMFVTVLVMEAKHKRTFAWQPLKRSSISNGIEIKKVHCPRFGTANAYHKEIWEDVYGI